MASLAAEGKDDGAGVATFVQSTKNRVENFTPKTANGFFEAGSDGSYSHQFEFLLHGNTFRVLKLYQSGAHGGVFLARKINADGAFGESFAAKFFTSADDEELVKLVEMSARDALEPHPHLIGITHHQTEPTHGHG
jgi:hypothetical protein